MVKEEGENFLGEIEDGSHGFNAKISVITILFLFDNYYFKK